MLLPTDVDAICAGVLCCGQGDPLRARVVRIKNTLQLGELEISESLLEAARAHPAWRWWESRNGSPLRRRDSEGLTPTRAAAGTLDRPGDQAGAPLVGEVRPGPADEHQHLLSNPISEKMCTTSHST